jgi:multiple sugar transport system substrate-binding protein
MPEYANVEAISRIDDLVANGGLDPKDFMERPWAAARWKDHQYAIPLDCHPQGLYYNTDLFKKAGIDHPPTNLTEFIDAGKKLTIDSNGDGKPEQWGFAFTWLRTNAHTFLAQYDSGWIAKDLKHSDLTSANAKEAFRVMTDLIYKYKICPAPEGQDAWLGFRTGKVAMAIEGIYMLSDAEKQEGLHFAGAPCPQFGPVPAVWGGSHLLAMPAKISPERRKASWEFMKYLSDHSLAWAKGGQTPVRKSILATPEFKQMAVQYEFSKKLPYVVYLPQSTAINQVLPFCDASVEAILNKIKPMDEALSEAARRIDRVLERQ